MNACVRETSAKFGDEPNERRFLSQGASVFGRFAIGGAATDVANANRVGIMAQAMSAGFL